MQEKKINPLDAIIKVLNQMGAHPETHDITLKRSSLAEAELIYIPSCTHTDIKEFGKEQLRKKERKYKKK